MDISAVQAKLLLSQIGGTKELIKANVAQNTKVTSKYEYKDTYSKYTENDINDKAEISDEAINRYNNRMEKNVNDSMEYEHEQHPKTDTNTVQNSDALMYKKACRAYRKAC